MNGEGVRKVEELSDEDIIEVIEPAHGSGMYPAAVRPPPLPGSDPAAAPPSEVVPRVASIPDCSDTNVSDLVPELARLSDPFCVPHLNGPIASEGLEAPDVLILTLVESNMN